jgi:hypothetical protein
MTEPIVHGHTKSGEPITDELIAALAAEAEAGYDVDALRALSAARPRLAFEAGGLYVA